MPYMTGRRSSSQPCGCLTHTPSSHAPRPSTLPAVGRSTSASHTAVASPSPSPLLRQCHLPAGPAEPVWPTPSVYPFRFYNIYPFYSKFKIFTGWSFACPPRFYALWRQKEVILLTAAWLVAHEVHTNAWFLCLFLLQPAAMGWDLPSSRSSSHLSHLMPCQGRLSWSRGSLSTGRLPRLHPTPPPHGDGSWGRKSLCTVWENCLPGISHWQDRHYHKLFQSLLGQLKVGFSKNVAAIHQHLTQHFCTW